MNDAHNDLHYNAHETALMFVDPYNDFISEGGKMWPLVSDVAASVNLHANLRAIVVSARDAGVAIFIVPHHHARPDDFDGWDHPTPYQLQAHKGQVFAEGSWGGRFRDEFAPQAGDTVVKEHWASNGFANTDLDMLLKQKGVRKVILIGLIANTCVEGTARAAVDLGYHVTLVRDATAAFSHDAMRAAHEINGPTFAHAIVATANLVAALRPR
jgi:nicotinamidase-related amidase